MTYSTEDDAIEHTKMLEKLKREEDERQQRTGRRSNPKMSAPAAPLPGRRGDAVFDRLHETIEDNTRKSEDKKRKEEEKPLAHQLVDDLRAGLNYRLGKDSEKALLEQAEILDRAFRQVLEKTDGYVNFQNSRKFEIALKAQKQFCQTLLNYHKVREINAKRTEQKEGQ